MKSLMTPKSFRIIKMLSLDYSENCAICKFKNVFHSPYGSRSVDLCPDQIYFQNMNIIFSNTKKTL